MNANNRLIRSLILGFVVNLFFFLLLIGLRIILIDPDETLVNLLIFGCWVMVFTLPIYFWPRIVRRRRTVYRWFGLTLFGFLLLIVDGWMATPDNPVTIIGMGIFWIGVLYLLIPEFVRKYSWVFLTLFVGISGYFLYARLLSGSIETYLNEKKDFVINAFLLPLPFLFTLWVYEQWARFRRLKSEKTAAELALLKTQVDPHFFFNTLNNLYALTVSGSDRAGEMILKLSDIMRYTIYEGKKELVSLADEVRFLERYLDLHRIRYHKAVSFSLSVEPKPETLKAVEIAPLLLIIPLENAIKHGVEKLRKDGWVKIALRYENACLEYVVSNNHPAEHKTDPGGIGLTNLRRRLELLYPDRHRLQTETGSDTYRTTIVIDPL